MKFLQKLILTLILFSFLMPLASTALRCNGVDSSENPLVLFFMSSLCLLASVLAARYGVEARERSKENPSKGKGVAEHQPGPYR